MKNLLLFLVIVFCSCASMNMASTNPLLSMQDQHNVGYWITKPSNNYITIIGISGRRMNSSDEITAAKEDAARKIAVYYGVSGTIEAVNSTGTGFLDFVHDSKIELNYDTDYNKYIDQLTYDPETDVLRTNEAVYIRFKHFTTSNVLGNYRVKNINGRPDWTNSRNVPQFNGYITEVGFAQNQRRLADTVSKSMENAVVKMIEHLSTSISAKESSVTGQASHSSIISKSEGSLINFLVIEIWIDPKTGYVYTLAVSKAGN